MPIITYDYFNLPEPPIFILCNPNREELFSLGAISERKYSPRFNSYDELSFRADMYVDGIEMGYYHYLVHKRVIHVEELGYFTITDVSEKGNGVTKYKEIECKSSEVELSNRKLSLFEVTSVKLADLLNELILYVPGWTIVGVDLELQDKYRSFEVSDTTLYNFLMTDISEAYECIFDFDVVAKTITAKTIVNYVEDTDIYLSYDNLITNIDVEEQTDQLITSLTVHGGADLDIRRVNPLGTNNIYNFDYFKTTDWMGQNLIDAINVWEAGVSGSQVNYANTLTKLSSGYSTVLSYELTRDILIMELSALETQKAALIAGEQDLTAINIEIANKEAQINAAQLDVDAWNAQVSGSIVTLEFINSQVSLENNFTGSIREQLQPFIIESSYINENFIQTDNMSGSTVQAEAQALYDQATGVLTKISEPRFTFSVDSVNFLMIKEFEFFMQNIRLGAVINVELHEGQVVSPILLGFDMNYDDPSEFKMIFGNRLRLDDEAFQFSDIMDEVIKASSTSKVNSALWSNWNDTYKQEVTTFISGSISASTNFIVSGSAQSILIDQTGLRGKKYLDASNYAPEQLWITNNVLAFTDDDWATSKLVIGQFDTGTGNVFGIRAEYLVGNVIAGDSLVIGNENNTFIVSGSQVTLVDSVFTSYSSISKSTIKIDPTTGIEIISDTQGTVFYVDSLGVLHVSGAITITQGDVDWAYVTNKPAILGTPSGNNLFANSSNIGYYNGGTPYTYIDSSGRLIAGANADIGGRLHVSGSTTTSKLLVSGSIVTSDKLEVSGTARISGSILSMLDEDNMVSNSATAYASQQSIKAYVDAIGSGGIPAQRVRVTRTTAVSVGTTLTSIQFENETYDTDTMWTSSANTRITFNTAGYYLVTSYVQIQGGGTAGNYRIAAIFKNGSTAAADTPAAQAMSANAGVVSLSLSGFHYYNVNDYIELRCQNGDTRNVTYADLQVTRLA